MFSRINRAFVKSRSEEGFTLIELIVTIIIIGILAAIAVPIFLNAQNAAINATVKSDVRNTQANVALALVKYPNATKFNAVHPGDTVTGGFVSIVPSSAIAIPAGEAPVNVVTSGNGDTANQVGFSGSVAAGYIVYGCSPITKFGWKFTSTDGHFSETDVCANWTHTNGNPDLPVYGSGPNPGSGGTGGGGGTGTGTGSTAAALMVSGRDVNGDNLFTAIRAGSVVPIPSPNVNSVLQTGNFYPKGVTYNNRFYFPAYNPATGNNGLGVYDGTTISLVTEVAPGAYVSGMTVVNGVLYFIGDGLSSYDGTTVTTFLTGALDPVTYGTKVNLQPGALVSIGSTLYFFGTTFSTSFQLWSYDISTQASGSVSDIPHSTDTWENSIASPLNLTKVGTTLYFLAGTQLGADGFPRYSTVWTFDQGNGSAYQSTVPALNETAQDQPFAVMGDSLYVGAPRDAGDPLTYYIWRLTGRTVVSVDNGFTQTGYSNGVTVKAGTTMIASSDTLYFETANDNGYAQLYQTDGNTMSRLAPAATSYSTQWHPIGYANGALLIDGRDNATGSEPWVYKNGTLSMIQDVVPGNQGSYPEFIGGIGGKTYLAMYPDLYAYNGTDLTVKTSQPDSRLQSPPFIGKYN